MIKTGAPCFYHYCSVCVSESVRERREGGGRGKERKKERGSKKPAG